MLNKFIIFGVVIFVIAGLGFAFYIFINVKTNESISNNSVVRVIDGDTFELASGDIVRLLCIDSPELEQEGSIESRNFLSSLILGKEVILESDVLDKDDYGRLLRYVYLNETSELIFVNKMIFEQGFSEMLIIPPADFLCGEIGGEV